MLVTMKDVLRDAEKRQIAVGAFNAPNLQTLHAILRAAVEHHPVAVFPARQIRNTDTGFDIGHKDDDRRRIDGKLCLRPHGGKNDISAFRFDTARIDR